MKKHFLILFFSLLSNFLFSQKYEFDYMLVSNCTRENSKYNHVSYDMVNSENHNYYMEVGRNSITNNYYSILFDYKNSLIHRYNLGYDIENYSFNLEISGKFIKNKNFIKYDNLKIEKISDLKYKIISTYKGSKKNNLEIELELAKFQDNLLIFDFEPLTLIQQNEILGLIKNTVQSENIDSNFYIKEITFKYFKNSFLKEEIKPKKINVKLKL